MSKKSSISDSIDKAEVHDIIFLLWAPKSILRGILPLKQFTKIFIGLSGQLHRIKTGGQTAQPKIRDPRHLEVKGMKVVLGIDVGGSTTKIVGYTEEGNWIGALQVVAADQITSLYGSVGNFTRMYNIPIKAVSKVILTGVGSSLISGNIYDIPTYKADEFYSVGVGGLALSGKCEALVISMGTGTAFVRATKDSIVHIGGSGVGGGTLLGLSEKLFNEGNFEAINLTAQTGNLSNVDLSVEDICKDSISNFPSHTTASNFGRIRNTATKGDLAFGLINMVFQTIGMLAVFACRNDHIKTVVLTGALTNLTQAREVFDFLHVLHGIEFIIPENAVFATAIGAAIPYIAKRE